MLEIIVAGIVSFAAGFLWYSDFLFGKPWRVLAGWTEEQMQANRSKGMAGTIVTAIILEFITVFVLLKLITLLGIVSLSGAWELALWAWVGFAIPLQMSQTLWMQKSIKFSAINAGQTLLSYLIITTILVLL